MSHVLAALMPEFLSTPSARRATVWLAAADRHCAISIHALREEGDMVLAAAVCSVSISIHALREEGDTKPRFHPPADPYFYPRPPRGGRPAMAYMVTTASPISIHALREEGDGAAARELRAVCHFYPRPPRGGRRSGSG